VCSFALYIMWLECKVNFHNTVTCTVNECLSVTLQWVDFVTRTPFGAGVFVWHGSYVDHRIWNGCRYELLSDEVMSVRWLQVWLGFSCYFISHVRFFCDPRGFVIPVPQFIFKSLGLTGVCSPCWRNLWEILCYTRLSA
jgi:hypothetical protein